MPRTQGPSGRLSQSKGILAACKTAVDNSETSAPVSAQAYTGTSLSLRNTLLV